MLLEHHAALDKIAVVGTADGHIGIDLSLSEEGDERSIHQMAALLGGGGNSIGNLGGLAFSDQVSDCEVDHHDLSCQDSAKAAEVGQQLLADNGLQGHTELHADLSLLTGGEYIHDTVNGIRSGVGM